MPLFSLFIFFFLSTVLQETIHLKTKDIIAINVPKNYDYAKV